MTKTLKERLEDLVAHPKIFQNAKEQLISDYLANHEGKSRLAKALIDPIRRRRYGGPQEICAECDMLIWDDEQKRKHTKEECDIYSVLES